MKDVEGENSGRSSRVVLGFDFGMRHIGLAVAAEVTREAKPLISVKADRGSPDWKAIERVLAIWGPDLFVVGYPLNMDGTTQWITRKAKHFGKLLTQRYEVPVAFVDERLSTIEAKDRVFSAYGYQGLKKKDLHAESARVILEQWLVDKEERGDD